MKKLSLAVAVAVMMGGIWAASLYAADSVEEQNPALSAATAQGQTEEQAVEQPAETKATAPASDEAGAPAENLQVLEASVATDMENRQPVGAAEQFPASVGKLYCYTKIGGGRAGDEIVHKWLKGTETMTEVSLKLGGSPWRVYSSKAILPEWTGKWSVEISQGGTVLKTVEFILE